jgi:rfaE bifunctional protein kinase chain/domain
MDYTGIFDRFKGKRILVVGDVMIDSYLRGKVTRISPEAPVPIVNLEHQEDRLGGSGNVALNLVSLGAEPVLCSVIGNDPQAILLRELLHQNGVSAEGLVLSNERKTTVKTRVIGNNQQLIRVDAEQTTSVSSDEEVELISTVCSLIAGGVDGLIFEDYNKGVLTQRVITEIIEECNRFNVITVVDPKKDNFFTYRHVTLFKPNLKELKDGLNVQIHFPQDRTSFENAITELENRLQNKISFVTLSEHGVYIRDTSESHYFPAHLRNIADVSGAGDTVISVAALCLSAGLSLSEVAQIANIAGGLVCEKSGVVPIEREQLLAEVNRILSSNKRN